MWIARALPNRKSEAKNRLQCRRETPRARKTQESASAVSLGSTMRKKMAGLASFGTRTHYVLVHFGFTEQAEEIGVNFIGLHTFFQDAQSALHGNRALVGPVGSRQSIENIAYGHHFCLQRNLIAVQLVRIAGAIKFFVMSACDFRHTAQFFGPRNLTEKIKCVHHVRFDLLALGGVQ